MTEFQDFYAENSPMTFILDTVNQPNGDIRRVKLSQRYTGMSYMLCPNRIMFSNTQGTLCLNGVKYIRLYEGTCESNCALSVVCGNRLDCKEDFSCTFIIEFERTIT